MAEEAAELQARIARLAGRINQHKTSTSTAATTTPDLHHAQYNSRWPPRRGTPYGTPRGRGWSSRPTSHRNKTLVLNQTQNLPPNSATESAEDTPNTRFASNENTMPSGWVTKHDRHMQLINNSVYEQKAQARAKAMEETKRNKQAERDRLEKLAVLQHAQAVPEDAQPAGHLHTNSADYHITVNDVDFIVADGGSKLIRTSKQNSAGITPKHAVIGGVKFLRSRHGNLYRAGLVNSKRRQEVRKIKEPCQQFSMTGSCPKGPQCRYIHDPTKVAICKDFLAQGKCHAGNDCDLSHDPTPERVSACLHFLRGNCTNPNCRYAHVRVNPGAAVCRAFATFGYCEKGSSCAERHVYECPDYANTSVCRNKNCRLPHVDRAGRLRKAAAMQGPEGTDGSSSDVESDGEFAYGSDDVDSEELEDDNPTVTSKNTGTRSELSQQMDYVPL